MKIFENKYNKAISDHTNKFKVFTLIRNPIAQNKYLFLGIYIAEYYQYKNTKHYMLLLFVCCIWGKKVNNI